MKRLRWAWEWLKAWFLNRPQRERLILGGIAAVMGVLILYGGVVVPILKWRADTQEDTQDGIKRIGDDLARLRGTQALEAERDAVKRRLEQARARLLAGDNVALSQAALQERVNKVAGEKNLVVQSTQLLKDEPVEPFRRIALRVTLSGELKSLAEFLSDLENGPQQLTVPFIEATRRGAVPGATGPRTLQTTVEVAGYCLGASESKAAPGGESPEAEPSGQAPAGAENG